MRVKIVYLGLIRSRIGKNEEQCEVADDSSLDDLLKILTKNYGEKLQFLFEVKNESRIDPTFIMTINGILRDPFRESGVTLKDGDIVTFMTLISGG